MCKQKEPEEGDHALPPGSVREVARGAAAGEPSCMQIPSSDLTVLVRTAYKLTLDALPTTASQPVVAMVFPEFLGALCVEWRVIHGVLQG